MRKATKKLRLNRETIGQMAEGALAAAVGMSTVAACTTGNKTRYLCSALTNCATQCIPCNTGTGCIG